MAACPHCGAETGGAQFCPYDGTPVAHLDGPEGGFRELTTDDVVNGRYRIVAELGRGGVGIVYLASSDLGEVAIKVLHPEAADHHETVGRFAREARTSSHIDHPSVVRVHEFGYDPKGYYYLAMELLEGRSLLEVLEREGALSPARAIALALPIAEGLARAHEVGVVHRDIKPENVMLAPDGRVTLMDFGLSKTQATWAGAMRTSEGQLMGTPTYMAPELWRGEPADARTDVYAFGALLHELVSGAPPFVERTVVALMRAHLGDPPPRLTGAIPAPLAELTRRCLEKDPARRPADMGVVRDALAQL